MKRRLCSSTLLAVVLAGMLPLVLGALAAHAEDDDASASQELPVPADKSAIVMNFENVELTAFIKFISKVTGRNIVFGDKIEGTVSVVSPTPVNVEQAFAMFQSVLATQGLTTVDEGAVMRIVPTKDARTAGTAVVDGGRTTAGFATRLISLRYVNAGDIARVLAPQVSKDGSIVPYEGTNTVIISDSASNLSRLAEMVSAMDIPGHEQVVQVIPLKHAEAVRTSEQIVDLLLGQSGGGGGRRRGGGGGGGGGGDEKEKNLTTSPLQLGFKITPDERTNSLVVMAPAAEMARVRALAAGLDTEIRPGEERIHVYYAKSADAESLVEVISAMLQGSKGQTRRKPGKKDEPNQSSLSSTQPASSQSLAQSSPSSPPSASNDVVSITADPATNAVIVDGPKQEWNTILNLLQKLDIPRPQVFIEAIIIEASTNKAKALGLDYQAVASIGAGDLLLRSNIAQLGSAFVNPLALGGLVAAAASDKTVTLPDGTQLPANYALLQALDATNDIEVLSAPTMLTLDNQEAEILVGQNIPFVTGRTADITNIENVFTQVERKDVGIKLRVRPQVAEGDLVVLDVYQEVSALVRQDLNAQEVVQVGPTTTIRSASTVVSVGDGRTVVIGGLISNRGEAGESKVPVLGDIPLIGRLFRYERKDKEKVNLIIFLTPHVIRSPRDLDFVSGDRRAQFRSQMRDPETLLPGDPVTIEREQRTELETHTKPAVVKSKTTVKTTTPVSTKVEETTTVAPAAVKAGPPPAPAKAADDASRDHSTYRHSANEKASRTYPLDKDTRERAPF
ncbi:MAG TPA: type II secretion system secretin GspD [Candidatus Limnocylindrales bacterium]|nr:type II secretion system secretin GspD [Candidatus Limnocylindrales bacterium]